MKIWLVPSAMAMIWPQIGNAQVVGERTAAGCINTAESDAPVSVHGRLVRATFTDTYGQERVYLVQVPKPTCIDDGGEFADPTAQFLQVQVAGTNSAIHSELRKLVGRRVTVAGTAFAAHTRHHHTPMIVIVDRIVSTGG